MMPTLRLLLLRLLALGLLFGAAPASADDTVSLDFVDTDIAAVAKAVGYITQRNFILDPRVKGGINIVSSRPLPRGQVYAVFLAALRTQGYTVVEGRGALKIVPEADAKQNYTVTAGKRLKSGGDALVTQVYPLQFADAAQMLPVLRPLISPNNVISALPVGNLLVMTDYADNLKRLDRLIEAMDQPAGRDAEVIALRHAMAADVAALLQKVLGEVRDEPASQKLHVAADVRSNSLLIRGDNPSRVMRLRQMVVDLDKPDAQGGTPRVIYLRNADATKLAQTLRGALAAAGAPAAADAPATSPSAPAAAAGTGALQILADAAANALILTGPAILQAQYAAIIEKLDTRPAEVFVEALIVEMSAEKATEFGIQWQFADGLSGRSDAGLIGGVNFGGSGNNILQASQNLAGVGRGINLGYMDGTLTLPINGTEVKILNLGVLARALEAKTGANILSAPNLLTLDNEEAKIVIGQNVPFVTGQYTLNNTSGTTSPFQTIQRQDVGLTLKVKPQISENGDIRLKLYQEVSSLRQTTDIANLITDKRSIETTVVVDDGRIVVLGGLMEDRFQDGQDKVPLLGDVPLLGRLFRYDSRKQVKTNLFVFLRPTVVRDGKSLDALSGARYNYVRGRFGDGGERAGMAIETPPAEQLWLKPDTALGGNADR